MKKYGWILIIVSVISLAAQYLGYEKKPERELASPNDSFFVESDYIIMEAVEANEADLIIASSDEPTISDTTEINTDVSICGVEYEIIKEDPCHLVIEFWMADWTIVSIFSPGIEMQKCVRCVITKEYSIDVREPTELIISFPEPLADK